MELENLKLFLANRFPDETGDPIEVAIRLLETIAPPPSKLLWTASVFHHDGLGHKIKELGIIEAATLQDGEQKAMKLADKLLGEGKWIQVKVKPSR